MNVLRFKALCAFAIPLMQVASAGLGAVALQFPNRALECIIASIVCNACSAAFSGLNSFLSTSFASHQARQIAEQSAELAARPYPSP